MQAQATLLCFERRPRLRRDRRVCRPQASISSSRRRWRHAVSRGSHSLVLQPRLSVRRKFFLLLCTHSSTRANAPYLTPRIVSSCLLPSRCPLHCRVRGIAISFLPFERFDSYFPFDPSLSPHLPQRNQSSSEALSEAQLALAPVCAAMCCYLISSSMASAQLRHSISETTRQPAGEEQRLAASASALSGQLVTSKMASSGESSKVA